MKTAMKTAMKTLYLIGGTMGVGKTTVCQCMKNMRPGSVFLDGDWCWDAHPFVVTEETKAMVLDNITHLLDNFIGCSAYESVIFGWVMHEQTIISDILSRLHTEMCRVVCVSLVCDEAALERRIRGDMAAGKRCEADIARSMQRLPLYEKLDTIRIDTTGKAPEEIAAQILQL